MEEQEAAQIDRGHDALILIALVDLCAHVAVEYGRLEPLECFGGVWLRGTAKVGALGGVDAGESDGNLDWSIKGQRQVGTEAGWLAAETYSLPL